MVWLRICLIRNKIKRTNRSGEFGNAKIHQLLCIGTVGPELQNVDKQLAEHVLHRKLLVLLVAETMSNLRNWER